MKTVVISFGLLILSLLILFRIPAIYHVDNTLTNYNWIALFSVLFLAIGIVLSRKLFTRTVVVTQQEPAIINYESLIKAGISKREADILLLMDKGLSNQQIADKLFISENTIKKHIRTIFIDC